MTKLKKMSVNCGDMVITKLGGMECMITCVAVRFGATTYEATYLLNGEFIEIWLREDEFYLNEDTDKKIGFK